MPTAQDIKRYRENWQDEIDSAARYRAMADAEGRAGVATVYRDHRFEPPGFAAPLGHKDIRLAPAAAGLGRCWARTTWVQTELLGLTDDEREKLAEDGVFK